MKRSPDLDAVLSAVAEALHYFGAHSPDSPRHEAWEALEKFLSGTSAGSARPPDRSLEHSGTPASIARLKQAHSSIRSAWLDHPPRAEPIDSAHGHPVYRQSQDEECFFCAVIAGWEHAERRVVQLEEALRLYADPDTWDEDDWGVTAVNTAEYGEPGAAARAVLAGGTPPPGEQTDAGDAASGVRAEQGRDV